MTAMHHDRAEAEHADIDRRGARPATGSFASPASVDGSLLALQRSVGNQAVLRLLPAPRAGHPPGVFVQRATGLADEGQRNGYLTDVREVFKHWGDHTALRRKQLFLAALNVRLEAVNAFPVFPSPLPGAGKEAGGSTYGSFTPGFWAISLQDEGFANDADEKTRAGAAETVYHEGRHAEQYSRVLRLLAGSLGKGAQLKELMSALREGNRGFQVLPDAAEFALRNPLSVGRVSTAEQEETLVWAHSMGPKNEEALAALAAAQKAMMAAKDEYGRVARLYRQSGGTSHRNACLNAGRAYLAALERYSDAYLAYSTQAHEADAFELGRQIAGAFHAKRNLTGRTPPSSRP